MKKLSTLLSISGLLFLIACTEKDSDYYQKNPEKAKAKIKACEDKLIQAFSKNDKAALKKVEEDSGCDAADKAIKAIKKAEREAERTAIENENKALLEKYGDLDWKAFIKVYRQDQCQFHFILPRKLTEKEAECEVLNRHYEKLIAAAENDFANQPFDALIKKEKSLCALDKSIPSPCSIWKNALVKSAKNTFKDTNYEALFEQRKTYCEIQSEFKYDFCRVYENILAEKKEMVVNQYVQDDQLFTTEYNNCYQKSLTTQAKGFYSGGEILAREDAVCHAVGQAIRHRGLYNKLSNFKTPIDQ